MKEKAEANTQDDAEAEATALAAAQEAAQLIAMNVEEGEVSEEVVSSSLSSDTNDEGILGTPMDLTSTSDSAVAQPDSQDLPDQPVPESSSTQTGKKGMKKKNLASTGSQVSTDQKATSKKQRQKARKASAAAAANTQPATKAKKTKKAKKSKKSKASPKTG